MLIFDDADDLFTEPMTRLSLEAIKIKIDEAKVDPQYILFSSTFPE